MNKIEPLYKITTAGGMTRFGWHNQTHWKKGVWHKARRLREGETAGRVCCSDRVLHAFRTVENANRFVRNSAARFRSFKTNKPVKLVLWYAEGAVAVENTVHPKVGCTRLRIMKRVKPNPFQGKEF